MIHLQYGHCMVKQMLSDDQLALAHVTSLDYYGYWSRLPARVSKSRAADTTATLSSLASAKSRLVYPSGTLVVLEKAIKCVLLLLFLL